MIFLGERSLGRGIDQFITHYHTERIHHGIGNELIAGEDPVGQTKGEIVFKSFRLGFETIRQIYIRQ